MNLPTRWGSRHAKRLPAHWVSVWRTGLAWPVPRRRAIWRILRRRGHSLERRRPGRSYILLRAGLPGLWRRKWLTLRRIHIRLPRLLVSGLAWLRIWRLSGIRLANRLALWRIRLSWLRRRKWLARLCCIRLAWL